MSTAREALQRLVDCYETSHSQTDRQDAWRQARAALSQPAVQGNEDSRLAAKYESTYGTIQDGLLAEMARLQVALAQIDAVPPYLSVVPQSFDKIDKAHASSSDRFDFARLILAALAEKE
jgi:hypothetical protein